MNPDSPTPRTPRILLVEDEQVVAMDMEMQLAALGYEVTGIAATGKEGLRLAEQTLPDLILMDIQLRGSLDGFATASEIQKKRTVPVVFVSAFSSGEAHQRAEEVSARGFLTKPFRSEDLHAAVRAALEPDKVS